jgi:radical SAM protein
MPDETDVPAAVPLFDQTPFVVVWESTRACDLVCRHCRADSQPDAHPRQLVTAEVKALFEHVRTEFGPVLLVVTGGDPLKRNDLFELLRFGADLGLRMAVTPSATPLLTREAVQRFKESGVQRMAVSLDGADADTHDGFRGFPGTFARTMAALEEGQRIAMETQINTSISRHNANQLDTIAAIGKRLGIVLWSVFILVPTGRATTAMIIDPHEHERVYRHLARIALDPATPFDIKTTAGQPYYRARMQEIRARGLDLGAVQRAQIGRLRAPGGVNDGNGFVFIGHTGEICPSGFLPIVCGNIREQRLADVYRTNPVFRRLRRPTTFTGKCARCDFNHLCGGSRSRTYALTGDAFGSDPTCVYVPPVVVP